MLKDLFIKARTVRRFDETKEITMEQLRDLVDFARFSPSGGNFQPLKFALVCDPEKNKQVFDTLAWAAYYKDWAGAVEGERPTGYIAIFRDTDLIKQLTWDDGIMAQSIFIGAYDMGLSGCMIGGVKKQELHDILKISDKYELSLIIALGYAKEEIVLETLEKDGDVKYWRDSEGRHHVPKRKREDLIIGEY